MVMTYLPIDSLKLILLLVENRINIVFKILLLSTSDDGG